MLARPTWRSRWRRAGLSAARGCCTAVAARAPVGGRAVWWRAGPSPPPTPPADLAHAGAACAGVPGGGAGPERARGHRRQPSKRRGHQQASSAGRRARRRGRSSAAGPVPRECWPPWARAGPRARWRLRGVQIRRHRGLGGFIGAGWKART
ncbi:hypothetical protein QJS66_04800 [Kocuria rhizophila]|nr:hypothetical protein QJS66_04800 [Kocuria rhizophila]